MSNLRTSF